VPACIEEDLFQREHLRKKGVEMDEKAQFFRTGVREWILADTNRLLIFGNFRHFFAR
jgi:hypothetical protein